MNELTEAINISRDAIVSPDIVDGHMSRTLTFDADSIAADKGAGNPLTLFVAMAGVNAVIEAVVCFIVGTAITKALSATPSKKKK